MHAEAFGEGGFAGRRRTGDQDELDARALLFDLVGDLGDFFLVQCLGDPDEVGAFLGRDDFVEASDGIDVENASPFFVFLKNLEQLGLRPQGRYLRRHAAVGELDDESRRHVDQFDVGDRAARVGEGAVGEVGVAFAGIDHDFRRIAELQQVSLVGKILFLEMFHRLGVDHLAPQDRLVAAGYVLQCGLELIELLEVDAFASVLLKRAVKPGAHGMFDGQAGGGEQAFDGLGEQETGGGAVDAPAVGIGEGQEGDLAVHFEQKLQRDDHVVDHRADVMPSGLIGFLLQQRFHRRPECARHFPAVTQTGGNLPFLMHDLPLCRFPMIGQALCRIFQRLESFP